MTKIISMTGAVFLLLFSSYASAANERDRTADGLKQSDAIVYPPEVEAAIIESGRVAQEWLKLIDQGKYAESWEQAAALFQRTITKSGWVMALDLIRKPLGPVRARILKQQRPAWNPKGLPEGDYMVIEYSTSFTQTTRSGELITMMREQDGDWKVLTYFVN